MGFEYDSRSKVIWLTKRDRLPDTCCSCGLFTDNRVAIKHVEHVTKVVKGNSGCLVALLTLVMHVALGPVGWLFSALAEGDGEKLSTRTIKIKSQVKISQCPLCHATAPAELIDVRGSSFSFLVHPKFATRLEERKQEET